MNKEDYEENSGILTFKSLIGLQEIIRNEDPIKRKIGIEAQTNEKIGLRISSQLNFSPTRDGGF